MWIFGLPLGIALFAAFKPDWVSNHFNPIWSFLDRTYTAAGYLAALFMCIILLITIGQMSSRWLGLTFEARPSLQAMRWLQHHFCPRACTVTRLSYPGVGVVESQQLDTLLVQRLCTGDISGCRDLFCAIRREDQQNVSDAQRPNTRTGSNSRLCRTTASVIRDRAQSVECTDG